MRDEWQSCKLKLPAMGQQIMVKTRAGEERKAWRDPGKAIKIERPDIDWGEYVWIIDDGYTYEGRAIHWWKPIKRSLWARLWGIK